MSNEQTRDAFEAWCKGFCTGILLDDDAKWAKLAALDAWQAATLAAQSKRQPLTGKQLRDVARAFKGNTQRRLRDHWDEVEAFVREVEAAHGITQPQGNP